LRGQFARSRGIMRGAVHSAMTKSPPTRGPLSPRRSKKNSLCLREPNIAHGIGMPRLSWLSCVISSVAAP
jgi:hypothetical protein